MTVNELIAQLQVLVAQGHGELDVKVDGMNGKLNSYYSAKKVTLIEDYSILAIDNKAWITIE